MSTTGSVCPPGACDLLTNEGCTAGQACYLSGGMPVCMAAGTGDQGSACTTDTDCREGFLCSPSDMVCQPICCIDASDMGQGCPAGTLCATRLVDAMGMPLGIGVCSSPSGCDILLQDCGEGQGCYPLSMDGSTICDMAGTGAAGDACEFRNGCAPGLACVSIGDAPDACTQICDTTDPSCPSGQACSGGLTGFPDNLGFCRAEMDAGT